MGRHVAFPLVPLLDQFWRFFTTHDVFYLARGLTVIGYLLLLIPIVRQPRVRPTRWEDALYVLGRSSRCRCSRACSSRSAGSGWSRSRWRSRWPTSGFAASTLHRAYVMFAPSIQFLLFAGVGAGLPAAVSYFTEKLDEPIPIPLGCLFV